MPTIKLIAHVEDHGKEGFIAWIESIKGMVVQAPTEEQVCKELFLSLKVKLAYDLGIPATELQEVTQEEIENMKRKMTMNKNCVNREINLTLS